MRLYQEILYRSNLNGGSEIPLIHRDPSLTAFDLSLDAFDPPSSTFSGLSPSLILFSPKL